MNLSVAWTEEAQETFELTVNQIEDKWGTNSAEKFVRDTHKIINTITTQPYLYKASYTQNIRIAFITEQTSMFYEVHTSHIAILFFLDNRQDPIL
ncbi:MAG TPA: type II toxin-antitoxin system RelE/ParE family toxin [Mucilaginibacter sp.]|nr:type II toxin-antitoxin system RelE/ParE family toxin [Mucilaginibacter sp.]